MNRLSVYDPHYDPLASPRRVAAEEPPPPAEPPPRKQLVLQGRITSEGRVECVIPAGTIATGDGVVELVIEVPVPGLRAPQLRADAYEIDHAADAFSYLASALGKVASSRAVDLSGGNRGFKIDRFVMQSGERRHVTYGADPYERTRIKKVSDGKVDSLGYGARRQGKSRLGTLEYFVPLMIYQKESMNANHRATTGAIYRHNCEVRVRIEDRSFMRDIRITVHPHGTERFFCGWLMQLDVRHEGCDISALVEGAHTIFNPQPGSGLNPWNVLKRLDAFIEEMLCGMLPMEAWARGLEDPSTQANYNMEMPR